VACGAVAGAPGAGPPLVGAGLADSSDVRALGMADRLRELAVTRVVMEATSDYWKPVFYLLEAAEFDTWLVNAKDVKHLPVRPKTDKLDSVWLCKVAERQTRLSRSVWNLRWRSPA